MTSPLPDPLKQEESSLQVTLGKRRELLSSELLYLLGSLPFNLKKIQESSLVGNMDRTTPVFKNNRVSFRPHPRHRKKRTPPQKREDRPLQLHEQEESSVYRSVGKKRPPFSLGKRRREKEESSVYPSVGKKRLPFSLGVGKRSCLCPLPLEKMEESMR